MMTAAITAIEYHLPTKVVSNADLSAEFPEWSIPKIFEKTGIEVRHIAAETETAADLGLQAANKLFACNAISRDEIDFLILCTQAPDYILPTTACILQEALGLRTTTGAVDINLGCSGFVYGVGLAKALIESGQARAVLLITAETYSRFIHPGDKSVRSIFGDGAAATLLRAVEREHAPIAGLVYGTDGRGAHNLIVPMGGARFPLDETKSQVAYDAHGNLRSPKNLYMNGQEILTFTLRVVPILVQDVLHKAGLSLAEIQHVVLHQANAYLLEALRKKLGISADKFHILVRHCGNTVSSTIPISLKMLAQTDKLISNDRILVAGFGVGYSWAGAVIHWDQAFHE